ncbi:hypothetical protein A2380_00505 [candidate division WWE3 bacterium RIFOXYB1_FULL_43_24]|uniref:Uncharacterized protein n=2 Tax=Katanobacteria TaxID=422282 RepID=A0A0G0YRI3_UNCKA|nr:MAG: hypothetical protein UU92_C0005G0030 [candidate division WWE3 bacterium GW2011_GWA1_42_12]KKS34844.1 MAG: hypothetical protein UU97_C0005G0010 [candidate division WWE3 bacterium GW2011_GWD1_42_14]KKS39199.1 MAG: hypothetical protein UV00_C0003G0031 [candidate division WWE3 bacterium GW2011_GWF1_42_14]KKS40697.1 MAG: hypothetical protein UV03_C0003G0010 [candidate division WWE3 bacterium GW2011_GWE1_42_16]KKS66852.1 MAG: hypothetical protein UV35_C0006G0031 [candidate division WWE3 bacte
MNDSSNSVVGVIFFVCVVVALLIGYDLITIVATAIPGWVYTIFLILQMITGAVIIKVSKEKTDDVIGTIILMMGMWELLYRAL